MAQIIRTNIYRETAELATMSWALHEALTFFNAEIAAAVPGTKDLRWEAGVLRKIIKHYEALNPEIYNRHREVVSSVLLQKHAGSTNRKLQQDAMIGYWLAETIFFMRMHGDQWSTTLLSKIYITYVDRTCLGIEGAAGATVH